MKRDMNLSELLYLVACTILALTLLFNSHCHGQALQVVPDCCSQAITLQKQAGKLQAKIDSMRDVGNRLLKAKDLRLSTLEGQANKRITELVGELNGKDSRLNWIILELEAELTRWRPFGLFRTAWVRKTLKRAKQ